MDASDRELQTQGHYNDDDSLCPEDANSCIAGKLKRIIVGARDSSDEHSLSLADPLSYAVTGDHIVIGRNEACDAYPQLDGRVSRAAASGEYVRFGLGGSKQWLMKEQPEARVSAIVNFLR